MGWLVRVEIFPGTGKVGSEPLQLFEVKFRKRFESRLTFGGQSQPNGPQVLFVAGAGHKSRFIGPVDETDHAVMAEQQIVRDFADSRAPRFWVASNGEEQLMLGGREASRPGLLLAPALEPA
jgi:hypothetical protein